MKSEQAEMGKSESTGDVAFRWPLGATVGGALSRDESTLCDALMSQGAIPSRLLAVLAFEAACERLRNALRSPAGDGKPSSGAAEQREACRLILHALEGLRDAYGIDAAPPRLNRMDHVLRRGRP